VGSIPSVSQCKIHHKFSPLGGDVNLRVCEHVEASLFVYIAQSHRRVPCRSRVLDPGSCSCGCLTRSRSELRCTGTTMPGCDSWTTWTSKCSQQKKQTRLQNTWEHLCSWCISHSRTAECHAGPESLTRDPVHAGT